MKEEDFFKLETHDTIQNNVEVLIENHELRKKIAHGKK